MSDYMIINIFYLRFLKITCIETKCNTVKLIIIYSNPWTEILGSTALYILEFDEYFL